jgi:hypothetical protein
MPYAALSSFGRSCWSFSVNLLRFVRQPGRALRALESRRAGVGLGRSPAGAAQARLSRRFPPASSWCSCCLSSIPPRRRRTARRQRCAPAFPWEGPARCLRCAPDALWHPCRYPYSGHPLNPVCGLLRPATGQSADFRRLSRLRPCDCHILAPHSHRWTGGYPSVYQLGVPRGSAPWVVPLGIGPGGSAWSG